MTAYTRGLLVTILAYFRLLAPPSEARDELIAEIENTLGIVNDNDNVSDRRVA